MNSGRVRTRENRETPAMAERSFASVDDRSGHVVTVTPLEGGWCVASSFSSLPLVFFSGAQAEQSARRLALTLAGSGRDAHVIVRDRRNVQIGTVCYFGAEDEAPLLTGP